MLMKVCFVATWKFACRVVSFSHSFGRSPNVDRDEHEVCYALRQIWLRIACCVLVNINSLVVMYGQTNIVRALSIEQISLPITLNECMWCEVNVGVTGAIEAMGESVRQARAHVVSNVGG